MNFNLTIIEWMAYPLVIVYIIFFLKIFLQNVIGLRFLRPLHYWMIRLLIDALMWPREMMRCGIRKFLWVQFTGNQSWMYDKLKFEKSKNKKLFDDATYFVYRTKSFECDFQETNESIRRIYRNWQANIMFVISWLPKINQYGFICHGVSENNLTVNPNELSYLIGHLNCDEKGNFLSLDECIVEIQKYGIHLPNEMLLKLNHFETAELGKHQVYYYDSDCFIRSQY